MTNITIGGKAFQVAPEPADYWGWIQEGRYNHEWDVYDKYLKPEHTFIDLGAWVGAHSLYASTIVKKIIAVEPDNVAFNILWNNTKDLYPIVQCHSCAVTDKQGEVTIGSGLLGASTTRINLNAGGGIGAAVPDQTIKVYSTTLRELVKGVGEVYDSLPDPLFIKIDVEGAEELIFEDVDFFKERKPTVYVEFHPFWWKDEAAVRKNFDTIARNYKNVTSPRPNSFVLEP